jgi:hypothetical protein
MVGKWRGRKLAENQNTAKAWVGGMGAQGTPVMRSEAGDSVSLFQPRSCGQKHGTKPYQMPLVQRQKRSVRRSKGWMPLRPRLV